MRIREIKDFPTDSWLTSCRTEAKTHLSSLPVFSTPPCCLCKFTAFKSIFMSIEQDGERINARSQTLRTPLPSQPCFTRYSCHTLWTHSRPTIQTATGHLVLSGSILSTQCVGHCIYIGHLSGENWEHLDRVRSLLSFYSWVLCFSPLKELTIWKNLDIQPRKQEPFIWSMDVAICSGERVKWGE